MGAFRMNQIRDFKNMGLLQCFNCGELKKQCVCKPVTQSIHYRHLKDMMFKIKRDTWQNE